MQRSGDSGSGRSEAPHVARGARDAKRRELIGLEVTVVASRDPTLLGLAGRIVDETRNTFVVSRPDGREARVGKKGQTFSLAFPGGAVVLDGSDLNHAPQNRIKKAR